MKDSERQTHRQINSDRQKQRERERPTDRYRDKQADRPTGSQTKRVSKRERRSVREPKIYMRLTDISIVPQCRLSGLFGPQGKSLAARHHVVIDTGRVARSAHVLSSLSLSCRHLVHEEGSELRVGVV